MCNNEHDNLDSEFACHGGDYDIASLESGDVEVNDTYTCYSTQSQCYIMKYFGNFHNNQHLTQNH